MTSGLLALVLLAQASAPVPTTVNGSVLGKADEFSFQGPGKVCLREASIELEPTESAYLGYSGIHSQKIEIFGPAGRLELNEGESWARPKSRKRLLMQREDFQVYEVGSETEFRYLVYGHNRYSEGKFVPMIWIDGDFLRGNRSDRAIIARLSVGIVPASECAIKYNYGWGVLLGDEPLVMRKDGKIQ